MKPSRGVTLVEMVVAMSILGAIVVLSSSALYLLMRAEHTGTRALTASAVRGRLARDFRRDVAASREAARSDEAEEPTLILTSDAATIEYRVRDDQVIRVERRDDEVVRSEVYRPRLDRTKFAIEDGTIALVLELPAATAPPNGPATTRTLRIEGTLGRELRLTSAGERP